MIIRCCCSVLFLPALGNHKHVLEGTEGRKLCRDLHSCLQHIKKMAMNCLATFNFTSMTFLATINLNCGPRFSNVGLMKAENNCIHRV